MNVLSSPLDLPRGWSLQCKHTKSRLQHCTSLTAHLEEGPDRCLGSKRHWLTMQLLCNMLCVSNSIKVAPEGGSEPSCSASARARCGEEPRARRRFPPSGLVERFPVPGCRNRRTGAYLTDDTPDGTRAQLPWRSSWAQPRHDCIYINDDKLMSCGRLWRQSLMCASCSYFQIGFPAPFFVLRAIRDKWHYERSGTIRNSSVISPITWPVLSDGCWQHNLSINGLAFCRR